MHAQYSEMKLLKITTWRAGSLGTSLHQLHAKRNDFKGVLVQYKVMKLLLLHGGHVDRLPKLVPPYAACMLKEWTHPS